MTHEEYMEEHGDDLMFDGVDDTERVFGECAACGGDFTNYDEGFLQDFEVANNEKLRKQIASLECQLQEALASAGNSKCKIHITVEGMCECETVRKGGEEKRRIPWEAD